MTMVLISYILYEDAASDTKVRSWLLERFQRSSFPVKRKAGIKERLNKT